MGQKTFYEILFGRFPCKFRKPPVIISEHRDISLIPPGTGRAKDILSTGIGVFVDMVLQSMASSIKQGIFMDAKGEMATLSIKQGLFLDAKGKMTALARKGGVFLAAKTGDIKKRHPRKDVSVDIW